MSGPTVPQQRLVAIVGTRPEAIKMRPVAQAVAALPMVEQQILLTGQHGGLAEHFGGFSPRELRPDLTEHSPGEICEVLRDALAPELMRERASLVVVQGDTTSALAGALAARDCGIAVAHVEAGLRSHGREPWPEEDNRVAIDAIAALLFAPTKSAAANLLREPWVRGEVHVTGNTGVDALLQAVQPGPRPPPGRKRILVTCHRRENQAAELVALCAALKRIVAELPLEILFLLHSNPARHALLRKALSGAEHILLQPPVDHAEMTRLMLGSWLILTDSGGLQEDGPTLGVPVLVMRGVTERVEAPANIELVGTDARSIFNAVNRLLLSDTRYDEMARPSLQFGDGQAALRIAAIIGSWLSAPQAPAMDVRRYAR